MRLFTIACLVIFVPGLALAACGPFDVVMSALANDYHERPAFIGMTSEGALVVTASPDGSTFSAMIVTPDGRACGITAGEDWQAIAPDPTPPGQEG